MTAADVDNTLAAGGPPSRLAGLRARARGALRVGEEWWRVVTAATVLAIFVVTIRGIARGFEPVGDNALIELRAHDVFTRNNPLLGTWSSASMSAGRDVNHPGPLLFDLFAIPVRLGGSRVGIAGGAALINSLAVWWSGRTARRFGGPRIALGVAAVAASLAWTMGSELMFDVWNPNILVLPCFAFFVLIWAVVAGDAASLPVAVGVGSLCLQGHVSYAFLVPGLLTAAVAGLVLRAGRETWTGHRRPMLGALAVGVVAWLQPLWEQFFGSGTGNLSRLLDSGNGGPRVGARLAVRMLAAVVAVPPGWARHGYDTDIPLTPWVGEGSSRHLDASGLVGLGPAIAALLLLAIVVGAIVGACRARGHRVVVEGAALLAVAAVLAVFTAAYTPLDVFGLNAHKFRWLWPLGALSGAVVLGGALTLAESSRRPLLRRRVLPWAVTGAGALLCVLNVPIYVATAGPVEQSSTWGVVRSLRDQLGPLEHAGTVWFDLTDQAFAEPYSWPLMAEMARRGIPFEVMSSGDVRQAGQARAFDGTADVRLFLRLGAAAEQQITGTTRIAAAGNVAVFVQPLTHGGG